jgi:putative nucleotidyltransferase with HDIG domain
VGRVCAYYHDIGKTKRPLFFVENQPAGVNPHANIAPALSAMIITSHTKDGVAMGQEAKLPQVILDGMVQHHGTGLVSFFYYKILRQISEDWEQDEELKNKFRYDGVKPQYREMGVLMLADCTEASVRSLEKPLPNKVENLIQKIIDNLVRDGQLDECDLSLRDLKLIKRAFINVYAGQMHQRIQYPEPQPIAPGVSPYPGAEAR